MSILNMKKQFLLLSLLCLALFAFAHSAYARTIDLHFALAASLKPVFEEELIPLFKKENPHINIIPIYDSSGRLEMQIKEGLYADLFFSAAQIHMQNLIQAKNIDKKDVSEILTNKLVLIQAIHTSKSIKNIDEIRNVNILAMGNPKSAPVGYYSEKALEALGHYDFVRKKLSLAQNVTEIISWVGAGSADAGIVYASDARSAKNIKIVAEIPYTSDDITYSVAPLMTSKYKEELNRFIDLLKSSKTKEIFINYGFIAL